MRTLIACLLVLAMSPLASAGSSADKIRKAMRAMQDQPAESRQAFAGAALAELTVKRLVEPLRKALGDLQSSTGQQRRLVLIKAFTTVEVATAFKRICMAGPSALGDAGRLAPAEQSKYLWKQCKLTGGGLISAADAEKVEVFALAAALVAFDEVGKGDLERELLEFFLKASLR